MKKYIYINGQITPETKAHISPLNPGFLFGEGLFETIRADAGVATLLPEHLARMQAGLKILNLEIPPDFNRIAATITELLNVNQLANRSAAVKLICSPDNHKTDIGKVQTSTALVIRAIELNQAEIKQRQMGMRALILPWHRDRKNPLLAVKSLNYLENRYALQEAKREGFDEGIFLNHEGELCEGTFSNLFLVKNEALLTPPLNAGILPGISRAFILKQALQSGINCQETPIIPEDLQSCEGAFLTSSLMHLAPLASLDQIEFDLDKTTRLREYLLNSFKKITS